MSEPAKTKRFSVDLAPAQVAELERLKRNTGMTNAEAFRKALHLLILYRDTLANDREFWVVSKDRPKDRYRLEIPE